MANKTIKITIDIVKSTETFKCLSKVQKLIVANGVNVRHIENGVNVAMNIGFEKWDKQSQFNYISKSIVNELLKRYKDESGI